MDKKEELKFNGMSYSILGETIIELPKHPLENSIISDIRSIYHYLKIAVEESIMSNTTVYDNVPFVFDGDLHRYKKLMKILDELKVEFEDSLSRLLNRKVVIEICKGKFKNKKAITFVKIKEAN